MHAAKCGTLAAPTVQKQFGAQQPGTATDKASPRTRVERQRQHLEAVARAGRQPLGVLFQQRYRRLDLILDGGTAGRRRGGAGRGQEGQGPQRS